MTAPNRFRFRAWNGHSMVYDFSIYAATGAAYDTFIADGVRTEQRYPVDGKIMQSTGLLDKNGVEIFEGDVLKYGTSDLLYRVAWEAPEFVLYDYPDFHGGDGWTPWPEHKDRNSIKLEVIGNIYQRPDSA